MLEVKVLLAHVLKSFKVKAVETEKTLRPVIDLILRPLNGLQVSLQPRDWRTGNVFVRLIRTNVKIDLFFYNKNNLIWSILIFLKTSTITNNKIKLQNKQSQFFLVQPHTFLQDMYIRVHPKKSTGN